MALLVEWFFALVNFWIMVYAILISFSYFALAIQSFRAMRKHIRKNAYVNYRSILSSPLAPSVTLIAPAFNEGETIIQNVRSLLSLHYPFYNVIIVNDGSTDDSLEILTEAYSLERIDFVYEAHLETEPVRGIYKSSKAEYKNLIIIDKENGGKADALNTGINVADGKYIACVDVDCIIDPDALLRMVKPFMEQSNRRVIASGGVIRIANGCTIEDGRLLDKKLPKSTIELTQVLEYNRAFLLGRMAWGKLNGLLLISGAFGLFDKEVVINCGGYDTKTVGEDMELVVRMRRYMADRKEKYLVTFIPDPLCWTEAPADRKIFSRQRNRWTRGTIETLKIHKIMFFNPSYGVLGMFSYPYWFFMEWMAPWIETFGLLYTVFLVVTDRLNHYTFFLLLACVYFFAIFISTMAILADQLTFRQYRNRGDRRKLFQIALLEPFYFHPVVTFNAIKGNIDYLLGKQSWGVMTRSGFSKGKKKKPVGFALKRQKVEERRHRRFGRKKK
ncbi:MAG: glycosyltransferase [Schleiferiaceae bacterium]